MNMNEIIDSYDVDSPLYKVVLVLTFICMEFAIWI